MRREAIAVILLLSQGCGDKQGTEEPSTDPNPTVDKDGDGSPSDRDCDDEDPLIHPAAAEICDELDTDEDCDGLSDDDDPSVVDATTWYADSDGDGAGDPSEALTACDPPGPYIADATDCDDDDPSIHPGATEVCDDDDVDEDCDGLADDASAEGQVDWYADSDDDGHGDPLTSQSACDQPTGFTAEPDDCDDSNPAIRPSTDEVCDEADTDENCDGLADDASAAGQVSWYADTDGDGHGDPDSSQLACDAPADHAASDEDCDDTDAGVSPDASELCSNGVDDDCDGLLDCEDGDCATSCAEAACSDGVDNDGDGDQDCHDEDCAGSAACTPALASVTVRGGSGLLSRTRASGWALRQAYLSSGASPSWQTASTTWRSSDRVGMITSLSGTMQVTRGSTFTSTCTWTLPTLRFSYATRGSRNTSGYTFATTSANQTASGSTLSSGCAVGSFAIPAYLNFAVGAGGPSVYGRTWLSSGALRNPSSWILPSTWSTASAASSTLRSSSWTTNRGGSLYQPVEGRQTATTSWTLSSLSTGAPYLLTP